MKDLQHNHTFLKYTREGPGSIVFSGAPDPDDLEDENQEYAQKQVEQAREKFCNALPRQDTSILRDKIAKWKELDAQNALLRQIAAERKKQGHCTIL
jgi:hypothetical protein